MPWRSVPALVLAVGFMPVTAGCGDPQVRLASKPGAGGPQREGADAGKAADPAAPPAPADRKIIYTATLDVVVDDLSAARAEVDRLLAARKGFVARSEVRTDTGARRSASYTLKVPVAGFRPLVDELAALGTPERNATDSQDVTEEYVDVDARVKNLKEQEAKLNELMREWQKDAKTPAEEIIKFSDRIGEVRQQVERAEGRLKYLATMAALSTVNLNLREIRDYQPPTAPTFGTRVGRTFRASWEAVVSFAEGVALFAVALTPWLPVIVPAGAGLYYLIRRARRASAASSQEPVRPLRRRARPVEPEPPPAADEPPTPPAG